MGFKKPKNKIQDSMVDPSSGKALLPHQRSSFNIYASATNRKERRIKISLSKNLGKTKSEVK